MNAERPYKTKLSSKEPGKKKQWVSKRQSEICTHPTDALPYQADVFEFYVSNKIQLGVAGLIFFNFLVASINAQIRPEKGSDIEGVFFVFEIFFAVVFGVELIVNIYGSWPYEFWKSGWNWFDFIIVLISLLSIIIANLPGISVLRLFRAFRVFRLFKRIPSLKHIIEGVIASIPGVANAFVVLTILMGIWSIMGVEFYSDVMTQEFGNFMKAMFTMWQVMTMDSWSSAIARPIIYTHGYPLAPIYFISYLFVAGIVMTNVIVAILLENYLNATSSAEPEMKEAEFPDAEIQEVEFEEKKKEPPPNHKMIEKRLQELTKKALIDLVDEVLNTNLNISDHREMLGALYSHDSVKTKLTAQVVAYRKAHDLESKI